MEIDWITVAAQIVNFLILVWLLQHFLYRPVLRAMDRREQRIADRLAEARAREREAADEAKRHRSARRDLEQAREERMADAEREAHDRRSELIEAARGEADRLGAEWRREVTEERRRFLTDLRRRAAGRLTEIARTALSELADADLEAKIADVFARRLADLDDDRRRDLAEAAGESGAAEIATAFDLPDDRREAVEKAVRDVAGQDIAIDWHRAERLTCGIELTTGGRTVAWSIDSWLDDLEAALDEALEPPAGHGSDEDPSEEPAGAATAPAGEREAERAREG